MRSTDITYLAIRQELLAWMNNLLQLNITKVEQCGTGYVRAVLPTISYVSHFSAMLTRLCRAAYCQILDSIYGNYRLV